MDYIELKIEMQLEGANDSIPVFSGFADLQGIEFNERTDNVKFSVFTPEDLASRIPAENISTRYTNKNIDGSGTEGLILPEIKALYVISANVSGYQLRPGVHTVSYQYNGGVRQAKLDQGRWCTLGTGATDLGNSEDSSTDTQRVRVYVHSLPALPSSSNLTNEIIILTQGETLPRQWYKSITAKQLLKLVYGFCGITDITFDTLEMQTYDNNSRALLLDIPPNDSAVTGNKTALLAIGSELYCAVGQDIYKRDMDSGLYSFVARSPSSLPIVRMWYNVRNNHLWLYQAVVQDLGKVYRLDLEDNSFSAQVDLTPGASDRSWKYAIELIDFNYSGSNYKYGLVYERSHSIFPSSATLRFIDGISLTDSIIEQEAGYIVNHFVAVNGNSVLFKIQSGGSSYGLGEVRVASDGSWEDYGEVVNSLIAYDRAAMDSNKIIYYYDIGAQAIASHGAYSSAPTGHFNGTSLVDAIYINQDNVCFFSDSDSGEGGKLYSITNRNPAVLIGEGVNSNAFQLAWIDRLYGLNNPGVYVPEKSGALYQASNKLVFVVEKPNFSGMTVLDVLHKTLNAFLLVGVISSTKKAFVYRRGDDAGNPLTTGNTLNISLNESSEITEIVKHFQQADLIRVSTGDLKTSYDGSEFDSDVLNDKFVVEISNDFIPSAIAKDIAVYAYQFFKKTRNLYKISLGCVPLFQYEPFDNCSVTFTGKIQKIASGPIYATELQPDGTMNIEVLL